MICSNKRQSDRKTRDGRQAPDRAGIAKILKVACLLVVIAAAGIGALLYVESVNAGASLTSSTSLTSVQTQSELANNESASIAGQGDDSYPLTIPAGASDVQLTGNWVTNNYTGAVITILVMNSSIYSEYWQNYGSSTGNCNSSGSSCNLTITALPAGTYMYEDTSYVGYMNAVLPGGGQYYLVVINSADFQITVRLTVSVSYYIVLNT